MEIGRVLRASTTGFAIGSRVNQLTTPGFGSLVLARPIDQGEMIFGLIYDINIDDDQLIRRLVMTEEPRQEVIADQRLNRLLPIEMSVLAIGYAQKGEIHHALPPRPPLNLDPVELCVDPDEVTKFTENLGYLRLILRAAGGRIPVDQLLVAHISQVFQIRNQDLTWSTRVVHELIELLRSNYDVLIPTLDALSAAMPELENSI